MVTQTYVGDLTIFTQTYRIDVYLILFRTHQSMTYAHTDDIHVTLTHARTRTRAETDRQGEKDTDGKTNRQT